MFTVFLHDTLVGRTSDPARFARFILRTGKAVGTLHFVHGAS